MKLLDFDASLRFFINIDRQSRQKRASSFNRTVMILYYFIAFMHFFCCVWLITGRIDFSRDEAGWYQMASFNQGPSKVEMYLESFFFVITTLGGAGFGNIVPSTNLEWVIGTFLNLMGSSLFICIFVDFVMEFQMRNLPVYEQDQLMYDTLQFAERTKLPESLVFKIRYFYKDMNLQFRDFLNKKSIVSELPSSIQGQVSIMLNRELI